jgi:Bacterial Ig domain
VSDPSQVSEVDFALDGSPLNVEHAYPYNCAWDASTASPGPHKLSATVVDTHGLTRTAAIDVNVQSSPLSVTWRNPTGGQTVSGVFSDSNCEAVVSDPSQVSEVDFALDGSPLNVEHAYPYNCAWDTSTSSPGPHKLSATVVDTNGLKRTASIDVTVGAAQTAQTSTVDPPPACSAPAGSPSWSSGFESGDFSEWSWWGQGDPTYVGLSVVDPASYGVPACAGSRVARFEITAQDVQNGYYNSKLYKSFSVPGSGRTYPPADVSGNYTSWFYIPSGFQVSDPGGVNMFQYKTKLYSYGGTSEPSWEMDIQSRSWVDGRPEHQWVGAEPAGANDPVAVTNYGNSIDGWDNPNARMNTAMALPVGRWFAVTAHVVQGSRIDWYVDGRLLVTNYQSEFPVGPIHGTDAEDWTWGIGNYSGNVGVIYADNVSYTPGS